MWQAGEDKQVEAAVARARKDAFKKVSQQWQSKKVDRLKKIKEQAIDKAISFDNRFRHSALFLIRKKHPDIDLSGINFKWMKGSEMLDRDDCTGEKGFSGSELISYSSLNSSLDQPKDALIVNIDSSQMKRQIKIFFNNVL